MIWESEWRKWWVHYFIANLLVGEVLNLIFRFNIKGALGFIVLEQATFIQVYAHRSRRDYGNWD